MAWYCMSMSPDPLILVVVPAHDRRELTRACLHALRRQAYSRMTVIVVDDGSTDGTWEMLSTEFPEVVRLRGGGDLWWTGATNLGCAWALAKTTEADAAVVTLNDDTVPPPEWLARLVNTARGHPRALVGSLVTDSQGLTTLHAGQSVDWWTAKYRAPWRGLPRRRCALAPATASPPTSSVEPVPSSRCGRCGR